MAKVSVLVTGSTGEVGTHVVYFLARSGMISHLYLLAKSAGKVANTLHNARVITMMSGHSMQIEPVECDILNVEMTSEKLRKVEPTLVINCAALLSLYPFFPFLKKRQARMGFIAGFAHTLPKDMALLWPLMKAIKSAIPGALVVNLAAPDMGNAILKAISLSPTTGAGTIDSTVQGLRLAIMRRRNIAPRSLDIRMVCHHALRRFAPGEVPFILRIYYNGSDITEQFDHKELIQEAADVSGVETMRTPVTNNAAITAASAVTIACTLLSESRTLRHAAGVSGQVGGFPVSIGNRDVEIVLPDGVSMDEAKQVNVKGMKMSGVDHIQPDGTVVFTERERFWIREGLGLDWEIMRLEDARFMSDELTAAYKSMRREESS
ncbi:MAG: KR domain-containing protein [Deltaproteobacteria bacterium]|nr:KR domain-containing protein [Deltaproteobacteria bacterium]